MPYNPGSAYPKKTTYIPPSHPNGLGINQAVNVPAPPMAPVRGGVAVARSTMPLMDARAAAAQQVYHGATRAAQEALSRRGVVGDVAGRLREQRGMVQNRTSRHGNPAAVDNKVNAEAAMDKASDAVIQSPQIGDSSPKLIIPKWENRPTRVRPNVGVK